MRLCRFSSLRGAVKKQEVVSKRFSSSKKKGYRAFRNRAILYTLIKTGMRRAAVVKLDLDDIDFENRVLKVHEKGEITHSYKISRESWQAIQDYLNNFANDWNSCLHQ